MNSPTELAAEVLAGGPGGMQEINVHLFEDLEDDEEALDEAAMERLFAEFTADFDQAAEALTEQHGKPSRTGKDDDKAIPLNGVNRFAIWTVGELQLYLAFAQEDRGLPLLLMLGTAEK